MADKQISQLVAATTLNNEDLLVIQQGQVAKKLSGEALALFVYSAAGSMIDEVNSAVEEAQAAVDELLEEKNTIAQTIADMAQLGTDTTLTTPAMAADAKAAGDRIADVEKDALAGLNQKTISDVAIASFDDGGDDAPVKELIVNIDPIQDLHGQDAPYPAGGGKNKWNPVAYSSVSGSPNTLVVDNEIYTMIWTNGALAATTKDVQTYPAGQYVLSTTGVSGKYESIRFTARKVSDDSSIGSGALLLINADESFYIEIYGVYDDTGTATFKIQLENGSAKTDWSPFSNICPITGRTGCEVTRTGKNVFPNANGSNATVYYPKDQAITISCEASGDAYFRGQYDDGTYTGYTFLTNTTQDGRRYRTFTPSKDIVSATIYLGTGVAKCQVEFGSTPTSYEEYVQGTTLSVTFPSEAGTVYGGTLNVTTGELVVEWASADISAFFWGYVSASNTFRTNELKNIIKAPSSNTKLVNAICSIFKIVSAGAVSTTNLSIGCNAEGVLVLRYDAANGDRETLSELLTGVQFIYELTTPTTYQLTPVEVRTLLKINNIWANTGNINTLIYRTIPITEEVIREIMGDYEEIIAGVESTGKATKNYYAGNLVIVNDILYKCLVNVASGETFTPGAGGNVSQTTIADELATLQALYDNLGNLALLSYTTA